VHSEHDVSGPANKSATQTLVVCEDPNPPETTDPPKNPRALKKKPMTGAVGKGVITAGNPSTPHLDDVSLLLSFICFLLVQQLPSSYTFFLLCISTVL
jgi:hypothetical protein